MNPVMQKEPKEGFSLYSVNLQLWVYTSNKCLKPHFDGLSIEKCKAFKHEAFACWNNCKMYWFADPNMKDG